MSEVSISIEIAVAPQTVWDLVMDPARAGDWVTIHRADVSHDSGPLHEGFRMRQKLCIRNVAFDVRWELVEVDAPRLAVWEGRGPARSRARIIDRLDETESGDTLFRYTNEFKAPLGPLGAMASRALVGGIPHKEAVASLARLKELLEGG